MSISLNRRQFLSTAAAVAAAAPVHAAEPAPALKPRMEAGIAWYNVQQWGIEGKGWNDTARYFDRLPSRAERTVRPPVWSLSRNSAGMLVRFQTDARTILARYTLVSGNLAMPHMPATGVSGLDLYARDSHGKDRWLAITRPASQTVQMPLVTDVDAAPHGRLYTAYLPLYNGVFNLEIGVDPKAEFHGVAPRSEKPIVFYGTSILHGACASRTGMAFPAILGRRFDRPTINLGFSGNGQMEHEVAELLAELDPCAYAIDCLPNMNAQMVTERAEPLVRTIRDRHPETPILLVEDRSMTNSEFFQGTRDHHAASRKALRAAYDNLRSSGVKNLFYLPGEDLLGHDGEGATDGSHPSDLGMVRYADAYQRVLRQML